MMKPDTPKFEPTFKDERDFPEDFCHDNGHYAHKCIYCEKMFQGHKRRWSCKLCDAEREAQKSAAPKQPSSRDPAKAIIEVCKLTGIPLNKFDDAINALRMCGFQIAAAPKPDCVGVEELKKNFISTEENAAFDREYSRGWNACVDSLAAQGLLAVKEKARKYGRPRGHAAPPGSGPAGETCGSCVHCYTNVTRARRRFFKCDLVKATSGAATDIRKKHAACSRWDKIEEPVDSKEPPPS